MSPPSVSPQARDWGAPVGILAAAIAFGLLFTGTVFHFWSQMALSVCLLCALACCFDPVQFRRQFKLSRNMAGITILLGILSAAGLYLVFYAGNIISTMLLPRSAVAIDGIYQLKQQGEAWQIGLLMFFIIGPGEEIFWRGFIQRRLARKYRLAGVAAAVFAYAAVHFVSGNFMLIIAALVCGAFWAALYWLTRSLWLNIISHTLWDLAVFIIWPLASDSEAELLRGASFLAPQGLQWLAQSI